MLPFAIGAVVVGVPTTIQTPDSGQDWPVEAVVPMGLRFVISHPSVVACVCSDARSAKFVHDGTIPSSHGQRRDAIAGRLLYC